MYIYIYMILYICDKRSYKEKAQNLKRGLKESMCVCRITLIIRRIINKNIIRWDNIILRSFLQTDIFSLRSRIGYR